MKQEIFLRFGFAFLIVLGVTFLSLAIIGIRNNHTTEKKKLCQEFLKELIKDVVMFGVRLFFKTKKWLQRLQKWRQQRRQGQSENEDARISNWWLALPVSACCFLCFTLGCLFAGFRYYPCNETFTLASNKVYAKEITSKAGITPTPTASTAIVSVKAKAEGTKTAQKEVTVKTLVKTMIYDKHYHDAEIIGEIPKGQNLKILKNEYGFLYTSFKGISGFIDFEDTNYTEVMGIKTPTVNTYSSIVMGQISNETFLLSKPLKHSKKLATLEKGVPLQFLGYASWFFGSDGYDMVMLSKTGEVGYVPSGCTYTYTSFDLPSTAKKAADGEKSSSSKDSILKKMSSSDDSSSDGTSKKAADKKNSSSDDSASKKATDTKKPSSDDSSSDGTSKKAADKKNSSSDDSGNDNTSKKATDTKKPSSDDSSSNGTSKKAADKKNSSSDDSASKKATDIKKPSSNTGSGGSFGKKSSSNTGSGGSTGKKSSSNTGSGGSTGKKSKIAFGITLDLYKKYNVCQEPLNKSMGVKSFKGHIETYYSERVLPGGGLNIPGRHSGIEKKDSKYDVTKDGTVRDKDGYLVLASHNKYISKGTIILTSLGPGKVRDCCTCKKYNAKKHIDIYVSWGKE